ncbi:MAG: hypothetical protein ABIH39_08855 [Candidatus Margulisiibacteriota bacterium]
MFERRTTTNRTAQIHLLNDKIAYSHEITDKYSDVVVTMDDIIRDILTIEFGHEFTQNKGADQMVFSIKKGLGIYLSGSFEAKEITLH